MDVLIDDQCDSLQKYLSPELALDNPAMDMEAELYDILKTDPNILPDEAFTLNLTQIPIHSSDFPLPSCGSISTEDSSPSSSNGSSSSVYAYGSGYDSSGQGQSQVIQTHGMLGEPQEHMSRQENFQLHQTLQQQQQQQQQQHQDHQRHHQQQRRHLSPCGCQQEHQSGCMQQHSHSNPHHRNHHPHHHPPHRRHHSQQQQQQQQQQHDTYYNLSGQPEYDTYEPSAIGQPSFPDSPPTSEEPYSPTENQQQQQAMTDLKSTIPGSLPTLSQPVFYGPPGGRLGGLGGVHPSGKLPQPYGMGPEVGGKLHHQNHLMHQQQQHHHHNHLPHPQHQQQQQSGPTPAQIHQHEQQQQQQQHRVPMLHFPSVNVFPPSMGGVGGQHIPNQISPPLSHMGSMNGLSGQASKKRKYSDSPPGTLSAGMMQAVNGVASIKQEPHGPQFGGYLPDNLSTSASLNDSDSPAYEIDANGMYIDNTYRVIKWQPFSKPNWVELLDEGVKAVLMTPEYRVDADKGFNFSAPDDAFVCQKKNHFQITVHIRIYGNAKYLRTQEGAIKKIEYFSLDFYGVKMESQNQRIKIEQSLSDRSKKLFHPVKVDIIPDKETKKTEGRLHFSETTSNNMRKKNMPNPDQRFFLLVVSLNAHSGDKDYVVVDSVSEKIIVRASNPGQFDNNSEVLWLKGQTPESVYHRGRVGVNTDRPDEALTVHGNLRVTGMLTQPSDMRAKENIKEIDPKHQLKNVSQLKLYKFSYNEHFAVSAGIPEENRQDTGVLAQEIMEILPDAVQETGDFVLSNGATIENFLVLNKDRLFMENVGAVKELAKLTDNLNSRIQELEKMNKRLGKLKRYGSIKSNVSWVSELSCSTLSTVSSMVIQSKAVDDAAASGNKDVEKKQSRGSRKENSSDKASRKRSTASSSSGRHQGSHSTHSSSKGHHRDNITITTSSNSNVSMDSSSGNNETSRSSLVLWFKSPLTQTTKSLCKNRCAPVLVIMAFCLVTAMTLYITEKMQKDSHGHSPALVKGQGSLQDDSFSSNNSSSGGRTTPFPDRHRSTTRTLPHVITPFGRATTTAKTTTISTESPPDAERMVPAWPACPANSCEKLCCPAPNDDEPSIVIHHNSGPDVNYNIANNNGPGAEASSNVKDETNQVMPSGDDVPIAGVEVKRLPDNQNDAKISYNVISYQGQNYQGKRRRRDAEAEFGRPHIRIVELNFTLDDEFCLADRCGNNSYYYYLKLHPYFGFDNVTLELTTPTTTYIAMCERTMTEICPAPTSQTSESGGANLLQQTNPARWQVSIGSHVKTQLQFKIIYSVKGEVPPMNHACGVTTGEDFVVITYNIKFQRSC